MKKKKVLAFICAIVLVFSFTACGKPEENANGDDSGLTEDSFDVSNAEVKDFATYLSENAYEDAITQYNEKIAGNAELEMEAAECIKIYMENTTTGILAGDYTEKEAKVRNTTAEKIYTSTNCEISEYDTLTDNIEQALNSKVAYESGVSLLASQNYIDAIAEFDKVLENDCNYSDAMQQRTNAIDSYKAKVVGDADACVAENDYPGAIDILKKAVEVLPEDSELLTKLNTSEKNYIAKTLTDAEAAFTDYTKYEDALTIIRATLQYYPDDQSLTEKRDYYNSFAPVNLYDMKSVKGKAAAKENDTDTYNNEYTKCFWVGYGNWAIWSDPTNIVYDLKGAYNTFSAKIYGRSTKTDAGYYSVTIYGDGTKLYENAKVLDNAKAFDISVDVTGVSELSLVINKEDGSVTSGVGITNMILQRTAK